MNIQAKFDGGKQYNRSQRGSWEGRCAGAGLRHNLGPEWGTVVWERATGKEANPVFKASTEKHSKQVEKDRKRKATEEVKRKRKEMKYGKSNDNTMQARREYARHDGGPGVHDVHQGIPGEFIEDMMLDCYKAHMFVSPAKRLDIVCYKRSKCSK